MQPQAQVPNTSPAQVDTPEPSYAVLGMHGADVPSVDIVTKSVDANGNQIETIEQRNVARIRMFIDGQMIDEDFTLPRLITVEEQIETAVTSRIAEIKKQGPDPKLSQIVPAQTEQIVEDNPYE